MHPEAKRLEVEDGDFYSRNFEEGADDRLILNMGPQHPSTHGVLRVVLELDGEYVMRADPVLGYIHRMHEKMGEVKQWHQYLPNMGRVDYLHALAWNHAYVQAVEKLAEIEVPRRAEVIRILTSELNRITSHLLWWGAYLLDLGAFTPIMYAFEDRERIMDLLQKVTGSRLTYCSFRFGGVCSDFPDELIPEAREVAKILRERLPMFKALVTDNLILRKRVEDIGIIDDQMCKRYGATGPVLRGSGIACDVRRSDPYSLYPEFDFEVPAYGGQDAFARYLVRMDEMEQSLNIVDQALDMLPGCDDGHIIKKAPRPGFKPPAGEAYGCVEGARGRIGILVASDGDKVPYRIKLRSPSFSNLSLFPECAQGVLLADAVSIMGSLDLVIPEIDR
ncbi:NADH-quinone oxidoreductase subunit D [Salidesulfovibrio brasiliensis]|uniref:NADH-quinone oxidoreductase subunit D n=1 Tax=Salidesulfovibrio brasiliensis TaxID=221711 RepID=UPI0006CF7320